MKYAIIALVILVSNQGFAQTSKAITGQKSKDTFIAIMNSCPGQDCGQSGLGYQRAETPGPISVKCDILSSDVPDGQFESADAKNFSCAFSVQ